MFFLEPQKEWLCKNSGINPQNHLICDSYASKINKFTHTFLLDYLITVVSNVSDTFIRFQSEVIFFFFSSLLFAHQEGTALPFFFFLQSSGVLHTLYVRGNLGP